MNSENNYIEESLNHKIKEETDTVEPKEETDTVEPKEETVTEEPKEETVTEEPKEETVTEEPKEETVTEEDFEPEIKIEKIRIIAEKEELPKEKMVLIKETEQRVEKVVKFIIGNEDENPENKIENHNIYKKELIKKTEQTKSINVKKNIIVAQAYLAKAQKKLNTVSDLVLNKKLSKNMKLGPVPKKESGPKPTSKPSAKLMKPNKFYYYSKSD
jgi:hypothetical protein